MTLQRLTSCTTVCAGYSASPESWEIHNTSGVDSTYYFALDAYYAGETGSYSLEYTNNPPPDGNTCSTAIDASELTVPWTSAFSTYLDL